VVNYLSPQVNVIEVQAGIRTIRGVSTSTGGLVGIAKKGPVGKATLVTSIQDFVNKFGGPISDGLLYWVVKGFYDNANDGAPMWIVRTAHYTDITDAATLTAVKAFKTLKDTLGTVDTLTVRASSEGTWGNSLQVTTALASRFATTLNNGGTLANGALSAVMTSTEGMRKGTVLNITDGVDTAKVVVLRVENTRVYFTAAISGLAGPISDGGAVTELSFNLSVFLSDTQVEQTYEFVSMEDTNSVDYVETRINGISNYIIVEDEDTTNTAGVDRPVNTTLAFLASGNDGLTSLASGDYIGSAASLTGMEAFNNIEVLNFVDIPESQVQAVQTAIISYCERRKFVLGILTSPLGLDESEIITYVNTTLAANTSRAAMFYKHLSVYDANADAAKIIPNSGSVMGCFARVDSTIGIQQVAAGELGILQNILGFENEFAQSQGARDIIYPYNINPLINHPSLGRCIFGSRTLSKSGGIGSQINERRVFNFIGQSLYLGMHYVLFKANTPEFRKTVKGTIDAFLVVQQQDKVITDFYSDVGDGLNNPLVQATGKLIAVVGIKAPDTIEFFEIQLTRDDRAQQAALAALTA
jgi:phage tail sheath protein FI